MGQHTLLRVGHTPSRWVNTPSSGWVTHPPGGSTHPPPRVGQHILYFTLESTQKLTNLVVEIKFTLLRDVNMKTIMQGDPLQRFAQTDNLAILSEMASFQNVGLIRYQKILTSKTPLLSAPGIRNFYPENPVLKNNILYIGTQF